MTEFVTVEPAYASRPMFALWCLAQDPQIMTSSATGFDVPIDLYPSVPPELLYGAHVDGFLYDRPAPQPAHAESLGAPLAAETAAKKTAPRKRATRARKTDNTGKADQE